MLACCFLEFRIEIRLIILVWFWARNAHKHSSYGGNILNLSRNKSIVMFVCCSGFQRKIPHNSFLILDQERTWRAVESRRELLRAGEFPGEPQRSLFPFHSPDWLNSLEWLDWPDWLDWFDWLDCLDWLALLRQAGFHWPLALLVGLLRVPMRQLAQAKWCQTCLIFFGYDTC